MSPHAELPERIYHLALSDEWHDAVTHGAPYQRSTLGRSLEREGFIHCSFASQVQGTADAFFHGRDDVVLLTIDPSRVDADIRVEAADGAGEGFPHIYGPLALDAVIQTDAVPLGEGGKLLVELFRDNG